MDDFVAGHWRSILAHNGLLDFDALWQLEAAWFEEPNRRRGGWSGVARCELDLPGGGKRAVFLKRQQNHGTFSWRHPVHGVPTFQREFRKIMHYQACGIPTLDPVYFAVRRIGKDQRAILVTEELSGFVSMEDRVRDWLKNGAPTRPVRLRFLRAVADLLRQMHARGIQHNCFFPKHVFTRMNPDSSVEARVIDLEKSRWRPSSTVCARRDLYSLTGQSLNWSRTDRLWFFKTYLGIARLTPYAKWLWRHVEARSLKKNRVHSSLPFPAAKPDESK
jgi:hypothetical protein